jgi:hypothetical protein
VEPCTEKLLSARVQGARASTRPSERPCAAASKPTLSSSRPAAYMPPVSNAMREATSKKDKPHAHNCRTGAANRAIAQSGVFAG